MYILGICNAETASACLMKDGVILYAASEERFTKVKMDSSFPFRSIEFCLDSEKISLDDIQAVAYSWSKGFQTDLLKDYILKGINLQKDKKGLEIFNERIKWEISQDTKNRAEFFDWIARNVDPRKTQVLEFYHHEAHAASASFLSPFDDGIVFTADGRGDFESTVIWRFNRFSAKPLTKLYSALTTDSLGYFYGRITGLLGFKPMRHEGKITGLAAYGDSSKAIGLCEKMIGVSEGRVIGFLGDFYAPFFQPYSDVLVDEISKHAREDIAAAAQCHLENMMCEILRFYLNDFLGSDVNLMCAGGIFGNVKVTQELKKIQNVAATYVQPHMGDGGLCLGAAALANEQLFGSKEGVFRKTKALTSMYLGPTPDYQSKRTMPALDFEAYEIQNAAAKMVNSLSLGKVVGLVQGRMEFGPRALCNRSIIYKTSDSSINNWLNKRMRRTEFMPFAPVIREEKAKEIIVDYKKGDLTLNFMTSTVRVTEKFREVCPAVVHVDQTARPQIVTFESNAFIWSVLKLWEEVSGELSLVNTSFNAHEEPIILGEADGLEALKDGIVDELWVMDGEKFKVYK